MDETGMSIDMKNRRKPSKFDEKTVEIIRNRRNSTNLQREANRLS